MTRGKFGVVMVQQESTIPPFVNVEKPYDRETIFVGVTDHLQGLFPQGCWFLSKCKDRGCSLSNVVFFNCYHLGGSLRSTTL